MTLKNLKSWGVMTTTKGRGLEKEDEIRVLKAIRYDREMEESLKATLAKSSQSQSLGIANHQLPTAYNDHFLKTKHSFFHTNKKRNILTNVKPTIGYQDYRFSYSSINTSHKFFSHYFRNASLSRYVINSTANAAKID